MQRQQKALVIIAILLVAGSLLYLFVSNLGQTEKVSVKGQTSVITEQIEKSSLDAETKEEVKEEVETAAAENNDKPIKTIAEEIKESVREVLKGAINLFEKDLDVVAIGDSLTQGVGDETEKGGYVGIINHTFEDNNLNITIENHGKRGNRSDQLLKRLENEDIVSSVKKADIVLITIGANDIMKIVKSNFSDLKVETFQQERLKYIKRLRAIFKKINELNPDAQIYLIGFYNPFEGYFGEIVELDMIMNNWNDAGKSVTEEFDNVNYIPTADLFMNSNTNLLAEDYFHPNTNGYKLIAKRVLEYLKEISLEPEIPTDVVD